MNTTKIGTILLATTLALTFAIGFAGSATAQPCHPSIDGGVTCQVFVRNCEVGAHVRDGGDVLSGEAGSATVEC